MNLEENSSEINCQEKIVKGSVSKRHTTEFLSPTRRSSRIRKPKILVDNCNINEAIGPTDTVIKGTELLIGSSDKAVDATNESHELYSDNSKETELTSSNQILENNCAFLQLNSEEDGIFEPMFDDIFGQRHTKTTQTLPPEKLEKESLKERKWFKRKSLEAQNHFFSNSYISNKNLPTEDVSKVFKIISKPNILYDQPLESKSCGKPTLKTYANKRKCFQPTSVVESFGLPDCPIASENKIKSTTNDKLDAEILDVSEITILDLQNNDEPWIITNMDGESLFPYYEDVRIKAEPDNIRINGSFLDVISIDNLETCNFNFVTSTPLNTKKRNNSIKTSTNTPKNSKAGVKNNLIDVKTIKIDFKKILNKKLQQRGTKLKGTVTQKKINVARHSRMVGMSKNSEMTFVKNDSFTLEDREIEISNSLPINEKNQEHTLDTFVNDISLTKQKTLNRSKKNRRTTKVCTVPLHKTRVKKKSKSSVSQNLDNKNSAEIHNKEDFKVTQKCSRKDKKSLKHSNCINELSPEISNTNVKKRRTPKKTQIETDSVMTCSNCITRSLSDVAYSDKRKSGTVFNKELKDSVTDKVYLNSSDITDLNNSSESSGNLDCLHDLDGNYKINKVNVPNKNQKSNHDGSKTDFLLERLVKNQTDKLEALKTNIKSNVNAKTVVKTIKLTKPAKHKCQAKFKESLTTTKRMLLRSSSQENIGDIEQISSPVKKNSINITECYNTEHNEFPNEIINHASPNGNVVSNVKVNLENCNFKTNINNLVSVANQEKSPRKARSTKKTTRRLKSKNICEEIKHLRKSQGCVSELKIVITPLDLSQLISKAPGIFNDTFNKANISCTTRRLRSSKGAMLHTREDQNTQQNISLIENCNKSKAFNDSQVTNESVLNTRLSDIEASNYMVSKQAGSIDSSEHNRIELYENRLKNNEEFLSTPTNDNTCMKNVCFGVEISQTKLGTNVTKIKSNIDNCTTVIIPKKEEIYKNTISEKIEKKSFVDLDLPKVHKLDEQSKVDEKQESIDTQNHDKFLQDECRKLGLLSIDVPHKVKEHDVKNDTIKKTTRAKGIDETNFNDDNISNNVCKETKLHFYSGDLKTNEQDASKGELSVHSNKTEILQSLPEDVSSKLETMERILEQLQTKPSDITECKILEPGGTDVPDASSKLETNIETTECVATNEGEQQKTFYLEDISASQIQPSDILECKILKPDGTDVMGASKFETIENVIETIETIEHVDGELTNDGEQQDSFYVDDISSLQCKILEPTRTASKLETTIETIENVTTNDDEQQETFYVEDIWASQIETSDISDCKILEPEKTDIANTVNKLNQSIEHQHSGLSGKYHLSKIDDVSTNINAEEIQGDEHVENILTSIDHITTGIRGEDSIINAEINLASPGNVEYNTISTDLKQRENVPYLLDNNETIVAEDSPVNIDSNFSCQVLINDNHLKKLTNIDEVNVTTAVPNITEEQQSRELIDEPIRIAEVNLASSENTEVHTILSNSEQKENRSILFNNTESTVIEESLVLPKSTFISPCHTDLIKDNQSSDKLMYVNEESLTTTSPNDIENEKISSESSSDELIRNIDVYLVSPETIEDNTKLNILQQRETRSKLVDEEYTVVGESIEISTSDYISPCHIDLIKDNESMDMYIDEVSLIPGVPNNIDNENILSEASNGELMRNIDADLVPPEIIEDNTKLHILQQRETRSKLVDNEESIVVEESHVISKKNVDEDSLTTAVPNNIDNEKRESSNDDDIIINVEVHLVSSEKIEDNTKLNTLQQRAGKSNLVDDEESTIVEEFSLKTNFIPCDEELTKDSLTVAVPNNVVEEIELGKLSNDKLIINSEVNLASPENIQEITILNHLSRTEDKPILVDNKKPTIIEESIARSDSISSYHNQYLKTTMNVDEVSLTTAISNIIEEKSNDTFTFRNAEVNVAYSEDVEDNLTLSHSKCREKGSKSHDDIELTVVEESPVSSCHKDLINDSHHQIETLTKVVEVNLTTAISKNTGERGSDKLIRTTEVNLTSRENGENCTILSNLKQQENNPKLLDNKEFTVVEESFIKTDSLSCKKDSIKDKQSLNKLTKINEVNQATVPNNIPKEKKSRKSNNNKLLRNMEVNLASPENIKDNLILRISRHRERRCKVLDDKPSTVMNNSPIKSDSISSSPKDLIKDNQSLKKLTKVDDISLTTMVPNNIVKEKKTRKSNNDKLIRNMEVNLAYENIEDNITLSHLKRREKRSKPLVDDKESTAIKRNIGKSDSSSSCYKELAKDKRSLKKLTNTHEVNEVNIIKDKKLMRSSNDKLNNNLSKKKNSESVEANSITRRCRPSRRKSVDHEEVLNKEKEDYRTRLRSKSVAPCSRDYIDTTIKTNEIDTCTNDVHTAEQDDGARKSSLRKCKSYSQIPLHSSSKTKDHQEVNVNRDEKSTEHGLVHKRKSNRYNSKKVYEKSTDEININTIKLGEIIDFQVGDLAWAQIGCHPYWPCLITEEPGTACHKKNVTLAKRPKIMYHVNFLGDNGRRAWITKHQIMLYCNSNDLEILRNERKLPFPRYLYVRTNVFEKWQVAVNEAENLKSKSLREKLSLFYKTCNSKPSSTKTQTSNDELSNSEEKKIDKPEKKTKQLKSDPKEPRREPKEPKEPKKETLKRKRKEKVADTAEAQEQKNIDDGSPVRKKIKKMLSDDTTTTTTTTCEKIEINIPEIDATVTDALKQDDNELIQNNNVSCSRLRIKHQPDEISEIDSKTSSDNTSASLYSMESQKALFKRNNLFKGVSRDKVCQYCLKSGDVLKCRGRCNGSYHVECAMKILKERIYIRRYRRKEKSKGNIVEPNDNDSSFSETASKSDVCENKIDIKLPKTYNCDYNLRYTNKGSLNANAASVDKKVISMDKAGSEDTYTDVKDILNTDVASIDKQDNSVDTAALEDTYKEVKEMLNTDVASVDKEVVSVDTAGLEDTNKEVKEILNTDIVSVDKQVDSVDQTPLEDAYKEVKGILHADVANVGNMNLNPENNCLQTIMEPYNLCNTPPRTNLSDLNNISVIEQIDCKMKDLRRDIINKTKEFLNTDIASADKTVLQPREGHVQIITVPSSVYNTPPRKTFPPDFKNMTLAEQIDYKMKEIMKKFESKTVYAESSIETSSEENSVNQSHSSKYFSRCGALFPVDTTTNAQINQIINKNIINEAELQESAIKKRSKSDNTPNNIFMLTKTPGLLNNEEKPNKTLELVVHKSFVRHVTADCDTESISDVQEDSLNTSETSVELGTTIDPKNFKCGFCISNLDPFCFVCNQSVSKRGSSIRQKCSLYQCGRFYHPECLKLWPQTQWSLIQTTKNKGSDQAVDSFVCPLHVCHTCASDDPRAATSRCSGDKIVKCLRCPSTYHSTNLCVPAGARILSSTQIICPRKHRDRSSSLTINTTWCFLCSEGGNLICCETCPTSVHPECLPVNLTDDDKFICEDCESGRLPLYDEIVWVKLGKFRWWPALILFPNEVPINVLNIKHASGEFVVKFFGTYDYYWVNRGRSFLFQEGDTGQCNSVKKKVDAAFNTAVEEAVIAHKLKKEFKLSQEAECITSLKPPPYIRIKVNKPVGNVRQLDLDLSSTTACECDPSQPHPCGPDSDCLNRLLLTECSPEVCPAGKRCKNQSFENREYPPLLPYKTQGRGWGLKTLAPIKKGQFVIEYVGELIDVEEYQRRIQKMHQKKEENYYFLTIDKDRMLDAGPKGNAARFMNHCCQPNCETQKWTVNGDTRVGLFATVDIPADTELTFNYNLECVGKEKKVCRCGAPNCSGFIGVKAKQDSDVRKPRKQAQKRKVPTQPIILPPCFICGKKGAVGACNNKVCNKTYHLRCLNMTEWPEGNKFICPWHNCNICSKRTIRCCVNCISSFCPPHSEGNIRYDNLQGFVCSTHDPAKMPNDEGPMKLRRKKNAIVTDETAVTSTTTDDIEDEDEIPLFLRYKKYRKGKKEFTFDSESESECYVSKSSVSVRQKRRRLSSGSQDEGAVSSATLTDVEDDNDRGKRVMYRRTGQRKKKQRLDSTENQNTAICSLKVNSVRENSNSELSSRCNELKNR